MNGMNQEKSVKRFMKGWKKLDTKKKGENL